MGAGVPDHFPWVAVLPVHLQRAAVISAGHGVVVRPGARAFRNGVGCGVLAAADTGSGRVQRAADWLALANESTVGLARSVAMDGDGTEAFGE